MYFFIFYFSF